MKSILRRLAKRLHPESDSTRKDLGFEALEPRLLFSAAPVEAPAEDAENPDAGNESPAADVQADAQSAQAAANAVTETESASEKEAAPVASTGESTVSSSQGVTLLELDRSSGQLNQETLDAIAEAAAERWRATGLTAEQSAALDAIDYHVESMANFQLGVAEGTSITLDDDAGGRGWFIDATPLQDEEYTLGDNGILGTTLGDAGWGQDLLTVLMHEQGHILGMDDQAVTPDPSDVMSGLISAGQRRLPALGQADGYEPGTLEGAHFIVPTLGTPDSVATDTATTLNYTVAAGNDRLLVVFAFTESGGDVTGVTFNGMAMNPLGTVGQNFPSTPVVSLEAFYLELGDSASATTADIIASNSGFVADVDSQFSVIAAVAYEGVHQGVGVTGAEAIEGLQTSEMTDLSNTVTSEVGDLVVGAAYNNQSSTLGAGTGQTAIHTHFDPIGNGYGTFISSQEAGAASVTMDYSGPTGGVESVSLAFNINALVAGAPEPAISIEHQPTTTPIADGDTTPSGNATTGEGTYFGSVETTGAVLETRTFTIRNTGPGDLVLPANPVTITGADASHFTPTQPGSLLLTTGQTTTFTVSFNPSADGLRNAVVHVANNDPDAAEADFDFAVQGIGTTAAPTTITQLGAAASTSNDGAGAGTLTTTTLPFTVAAGTNRVLVVFGHEEESTGASVLTGVTFESTGGSPTVYPLTSMNLGGEATDSLNRQQTEIYYLALGSGDAIIGNIVMTTTDAAADNEATILTAVAYENVDQTTPVNGFDSVNGQASDSMLNIVSEAGDRVVVVHANQSISGATADPSADAAQTVIHNLDDIQTHAYLLTTTETGAALVDGLFSWNSAPPAGQYYVTAGINLNAAPPPEIYVEHDPTNDEIADGETVTSGVTLEGTDFGSVDTASGSVVRTFLIRNDGPGDLILGGQPTLTGNPGNHFAISTLSGGGLTIASGGTRTFTVTFDPMADGAHTATVNIASNDGDEAAYDFLVSGTGTTVAPPATEETGVSVSGGNLVITDVLGADTDDDFTISTTATTLTIVDNNGNGIDLGAVTGTGDGTSTVTINLGASGWTGGIVFDTLGGDDILRIDFGGGANFGRTITFNGGDNGSLGDELFLDGGGTFASATFGFVDENDGSIDITGNSLITYTGLEPITSTITATTVTLNYSAAAETIAVSAVGASTRVDSTAGEVVTFTNPSGALNINAGGGDDVINVNGFGTGYGAALNIDGQAGSADKINFYADGVTLGTGNSASFVAEQIFFNAGDLTTSDGNITLNGTGGSGGTFMGVSLNNSSLTTGSGNIDIDGQGGDTGNTNRGVFISGVSSVSTTTGGNIDIDGTGGGSAAGKGVHLHSGSSVSAGGSGNLTITGTGSASGTTQNTGVFGLGTNLTVANGALTIVGVGHGSTGNNQGVFLNTAVLTGTGSGDISVTGSSDGSSINNQGISTIKSTLTTAATGSGSITLNGTGSTSGTKNNEGIRLANTDLATGGNGSIDIDGVGGGDGSNANNSGVSLLTGSTAAAAGSGTLTIDGTAGSGTTSNRGVHMNGAGSSLSTVNGNLTIRGHGGGSTSFNRGVDLTTTTVSSTGSGAVTLEGTGSQTASGSNNTGVYLKSSTVSAASGGITLTGNGGTGSSTNEGVRIVGGSLSGALSLTGTASGSTTGNSNTGVYILNANLGGVTGGSITGFGGGISGNSNHGIYMQGIVGGFGGTTMGTAGFGASSLDRTGDFPFV